MLMGDGATVNSNHDATSTKQGVEALKALNSYVPLLTIVVGIISFLGGLIVSTINARQTAAEALQEQWRHALEKVGSDNANLVPGAFLMESFLDTKAYRKEARDVEVSLLDRMNDPEFFDILFFDLMQDTNQENQADVLHLARSMSIQLDKLYAGATRSATPDEVRTTRTFSKFLSSPDDFFTNQQDPKNERATNLLIELDSVSAALYCSWSSHADDCVRLTPARQKLDDIILLKYDFSRADFTKAHEMSNVRVYLACKGHEAASLENVTLLCSDK